MGTAIGIFLESKYVPVRGTGGTILFNAGHLYLSCTPSLDRRAGDFPGCFDQGGPYAADRSISSIGRLLPIALCGRSSL
jgi:hypothetical protein